MPATAFRQQTGNRILFFLLGSVGVSRGILTVGFFQEASVSLSDFWGRRLGAALPNGASSKPLKGLSLTLQLAGGQLFMHSILLHLKTEHR